MAHPDDESFTCGGLIPKYVKAGWEVDLICATRGEAGNSGPYGDVPPSRVGEIRRRELEKAGTLLGISSVTFLGYMDGTLKEEPPGGLEDKIYGKMEELVPDVVITFDTTGISNHPDHVRICYAATFAFQKYAFWIKEKLSAQPDYAEADDPKLYYACVPESVSAFLIKNKVIPAESFGKPWRGVEDKKVTTVINTKAFRPIKKKVLLLHKTQEDDVNRFLSFANNPLLNQEYFIFRMHGAREIFMGNNDRVSSKL